jgi:peptidyl-prolyl cis-trans isomerase SurA
LSLGFIQQDGIVIFVMPYRIILLSAICLLPAASLFCQQQSQKVIADKITAIVGDRIILSSEIQQSIDDLNRQNIPVPANAACVLTEQAIVSKLLMLQALKDSLPVTDEDVESELNRRLDHFNGQSEIEIDILKIKEVARVYIRERMLAEAMQQKIAGNTRVSPAEVKSFFERIPKDSLPLIEPEIEVGQIIFYPQVSIDLEQYVIVELNNYKKQVESGMISLCQLEKVVNKQNACGEYKISRNSKFLDPAFLSAAFHLKNGDLSAPVKSKFGFYLIQMIDRYGDDATVRYIFRPNPVTDAEINQAKSELNRLRTEIIEGRIGFGEAALKYSNDNSVKYAGPFLLNSYGSSSITFNQVDKDVADIVSKMNAGEISRPMLFINEQNVKGVRIFFLKSRSESHRMNLREDYSKISQLALEEKRQHVLDKWIREKIPSFYIMVDNAMSADCPEIKRFASADQ